MKKTENSPVGGGLTNTSGASWWRWWWWWWRWWSNFVKVCRLLEIFECVVGAGINSSWLDAWGKFTRIWVFFRLAGFVGFKSQDFHQIYKRKKQGPGVEDQFLFFLKGVSFHTMCFFFFLIIFLYIYIYIYIYISKGSPTNLCRILERSPLDMCSEPSFLKK